MTASPQGPAELPTQLGRALAARRGDRTLADVARAGGITYQGLIALEAGTKNPTLERVARTAELYGARLAIVDVSAFREAVIDYLADTDELGERQVTEAADVIANLITNPPPKDQPNP